MAPGDAQTAVRCPLCSEVIVVPIIVELGVDDEGYATMSCTPDTADLWAHTWLHTDEGSTPES